MRAYRFDPLTWPPWAQMWALAMTIYVGCKWLTWQRADVRQVDGWKNYAYLFAWPGMDAASFLEERPSPHPSRCSSREWIAATAKVMICVGLLFRVARMIPARFDYAVGWIGMIGFVLTLHFGVFHLLSWFWRHMGVLARPLMNRPLASTSLSESSASPHFPSIDEVATDLRSPHTHLIRLIAGGFQRPSATCGFGA